ncbi:MAG TPA: FAD-dependent oxidoreductase, partial [Polyangiaceae bacterium]|nr:FAD-dependent oxidoreductase [Polyangiaceae bacterium]
APDVFELAVGSGPSTLGELQLGDVVFASAALGRAMLDVFPGNGPLQLIAMGTGVTPLRAVIQEQVARQEKGELPARSLGLLHGCRDESEQLFADEFAGLRARGLLDYRPVLSRPEPGWPGLRGRVQEHVDAFSPTGASYLVCGSIGMVEDVVARLVSGGVSATSILAEGY